MQDAIGQHGEKIFEVIMQRFDGGRPPRFRPCHLGAKWPAADFLVELEGVADTTPFFFVQVKSTRQGFTQQDRRLRVSVEQETIERLARYPAPTYIAGIDQPSETGFLLAVTGATRTRLPSLPTDFPLDATTRSRLYDEVRAFWQTRASVPTPSAFVTNDWR